MEAEWKPIKSAPKDGTKIDLWVRSFAVCEGGEVSVAEVGRYVDARWGQQRHHYTNPYECKEGPEGWVVAADGIDDELVELGDRRATHWMPLSGPPTNPKQESQAVSCTRAE